MASAAIFLQNSPLIQFLVIFISGVSLGVIYRRIKRSFIGKRPQRESSFSQFEMYVSVFNVFVLGGLLVGMVVSTRAMGAGIKILAPTFIGFVSTMLCLTGAAILSKFSASPQHAAKAYMSATFGGGNRGFVILLLLLAIFQVGVDLRNSAITSFYLVDLGNFLALLTIFNIVISKKFGVINISDSPTPTEIRQAKKLLLTQQISILFTAFAFGLGFLADRVEVIAQSKDLIIKVLSDALLLFSTFNLFSALSGNYDPSRIKDILQTFTCVRLSGLLLTMILLTAVWYFAPTILPNVGLVAMAILILYYAPPSSLADDIFAVNGAEEAVVTSVKEDAALLNLFFVAILSAAFFLVWFASVALHF